MSKKNSLNFNILKEYNLFELREIGRQVGVHLPTTYRKDVLISKIVAILEGKQKPYVRQTTKGRPTKGGLGLPVSKIVGKQESDSFDEWIPASVYEASRTNYQIRSRQAGLFMDAMSRGAGKEERNISGHVELHPEGWGYVRVSQDNKSGGDSLIAQSMIKDNNLRYGDYVSGISKESVSDKQSYFSVLETVNGGPVSATRVANFDALCSKYPNRTIKLQNGAKRFGTLDITAPIGFGQRSVVFGVSPSQNTEYLKAMAQAIAVQGIATVFVSLDKRPEEKFCFEETLSITQKFCEFNMPPRVQLRLLELAVESAKRRAEVGEDIVIFVDGLLELMQLYNHLVESSKKEILGGIDYAVMPYLKCFLNDAKNTEEAGSLTLVCGFSTDEADPRTQSVVYELARVANCIITLGADGELDAAKSRTLGPQE